MPIVEGQKSGNRARDREYALRNSLRDGESRIKEWEASHGIKPQRNEYGRKVRSSPQKTKKKKSCKRKAQKF